MTAPIRGAQEKTQALRSTTKKMAGIKNGRRPASEPGKVKKVGKGLWKQETANWPRGPQGKNHLKRGEGYENPRV